MSSYFKVSKANLLFQADIKPWSYVSLIELVAFLYRPSEYLSTYCSSSDFLLLDISICNFRKNPEVKIKETSGLRFATFQNCYAEFNVKGSIWGTVSFFLYLEW